MLVHHPYALPGSGGLLHLFFSLVLYSFQIVDAISYTEEKTVCMKNKNKFFIPFDLTETYMLSMFIITEVCNIKNKLNLTVCSTSHIKKPEGETNWCSHSNINYLKDGKSFDLTRTWFKYAIRGPKMAQSYIKVYKRHEIRVKNTLIYIHLSKSTLFFSITIFIFLAMATDSIFSIYLRKPDCCGT